MELISVRIAAEGDVARVRQISGVIASACGFENFAKTRLVTAVLEITRNALQYAGGGRAQFGLSSEARSSWLTVRVVDQGEGLPDGANFTKGRRPFKSKSSAAGEGMGLGLTGVQRLADRFDLETSNEGTRVELGFRLAAKSNDLEAFVARISEELAKLSATDPIAELSRQNRELAEAMAERELLIDEVHHRTGNNLALIVSFIQLSKRATASEETRQAMAQLEARVHSVAKVHQELQRANLADRIALIPLLENVAKHAQDAFSNDELDISISVFGDAATVTGSAAIDLGLIVNELITNSYKHAFANRQMGRIDVSFERYEADDIKSEFGWMLSVEDNGNGLAGDIKPERSDSLGWRMIRAMTGRLSGTIETGSENGFYTKLYFPKAFAEPK